MKILTIVGARPQFIKAAMVSRAIIEHNRSNGSPHIAEEILHTGQHYDENMSDIFFRQMHIPEPVVNLNAGTGGHGEMTGRMLAQIEKEILVRKPDWVLVYGDTNSTLAGALAAAKLNIPIAHVEAGLRSFNKRMPEEINRIITDHISTLLLCPTQSAVDNLRKEGFPAQSTIGQSSSNLTPCVFHVGDVMYDAALVFGEIGEHKSKILTDLGISRKEYLLATVHRAENTNDPERLQGIITALIKLSETQPVIFPAHPRTTAQIKTSIPNIKSQNLKLISPISFLDMVKLEKNARIILTDSGGVQKEAYFHNVPCITLRDETEWVETVAAGWNQVVAVNTASILTAVTKSEQGHPIAEYGNGDASKKIVDLLVLS